MASYNMGAEFGSEVTHNMVEDARECVEYYNKRLGQVLDYSVESLTLIDNILEESSEFYLQMEERRKRWLIHRVSAYVFEVTRRNFGGEYFWHNAMNQAVLIHGLPDYEISLMVNEKVRSRLFNGSEDNIPDFIQVFAQKVGTAEKGDKVTFL